MDIIAWLMELYENGIITAKDTDGIPMEWGSKEAILGMLKKMVYREGFGNVLADGILPAAKKIGRGAKDYANHMKGLPLYDVNTPEEIVPDKGTALSMVISPRGDDMKVRGMTLEEEEITELAMLYDYGDQTLQYEQLKDGGRGAQWLKATREKIKKIAGTEKASLPEEYEGKPEIVIYLEDQITINDCLSACKDCSGFLNYPFDEYYEAALFSAGTGVETSEDALFQLAKKVRNLERAYCVREGMTRETDVLPERFMDNALKQGPSKGAVLESSKFEDMKSKYYALRGWDIATGIPTRETLEQTGLGDVAQDLEKRGKLPKK